jgi:hypothetical protein
MQRAQTLRISLFVLNAFMMLGCGEDEPIVPPDVVPTILGISTARPHWSYSSVPAELPQAPLLDPVKRGQLLWFSPPTVLALDIDPESSSRDLVSALEIIFIPQAGSSASETWGGLVSAVSIQGADASEAESLEIWVNDFINHTNTMERRGELNVDIGSVSEDAVWDPLTPPTPPNGMIDCEDENESGGQIEIDEDIGLDRLPSSREPLDTSGRKRTGYYPAEADPADDDRVPNIDLGMPENTLAERMAKYRGLNGTEGNQRPDGEDLNGDFILDMDDDYLEFHIDLSEPALIDVGRDLGVTEPRNGWRLYRVSLDEFDLEVGTPDITKVRHVRVWFRGIAPGDTLDIQIADPGLR